MSYLITGGAGFIGSNLAEQLSQKGKSVRILDNFFSGKRKNLSFAGHSDLEILEGDIRKLQDCRTAVAGVDFVLHHAALASVPRSIQEPLLNHDINVTGTLNLLIAARDAHVKRFIFASSSSIYGNGDSAGEDPERPKNEECQPAPLSPYALSKHIGEQNCRLFHQLYGLDVVILRYFNVFGKKQDPGSEYAAVIPKFIEAVLKGERPLIYGTGMQSRDFVYIDDVVEANLRACLAPQTAVGRVFNIASGKGYNLIDILDYLRQVDGRMINPIFAQPKPGDIMFSLADISRARNLLGFEPSVSFREGLVKTLQWYKGTISGPPILQRGFLDSTLQPA